MDEIDRFKKGEGITYTTKELIGGLHVKLDRIEKRLENGAVKFKGIETTLGWHNKLIMALYAVLGAFLIKPVRSLFSKLFGGG